MVHLEKLTQPVTYETQKGRWLPPWVGQDFRVSTGTPSLPLAPHTKKSLHRQSPEWYKLLSLILAKKGVLEGGTGPGTGPHTYLATSLGLFPEEKEEEVRCSSIVSCPVPTATAPAQGTCSQGRDRHRTQNLLSKEQGGAALRGGLVGPSLGTRGDLPVGAPRHQARDVSRNGHPPKARSPAGQLYPQETETTLYFHSAL